MNFKSILLVFVVLLSASCSKENESSIPSIPDGGFEKLNSHINYWDIMGSYISHEVTTTNAYDGNRCFYNVNNSSRIDIGIATSSRMTLKTPIKIEPNVAYEISAWMRVEGNHGNRFKTHKFNVKQDDKLVAEIDMELKGDEVIPEDSWDESYYEIEDTGWIYKSQIFSVTDDVPITIEIILPFQYTWIDNLKLTPM